MKDIMRFIFTNLIILFSFLLVSPAIAQNGEDVRYQIIIVEDPTSQDHTQKATILLDTKTGKIWTLETLSTVKDGKLTPGGILYFEERTTEGIHETNTYKGLKKEIQKYEEVKSDSQFKLAIFPWALTSGFIEKKERFVEAFTQILIANPLFVPIYSSYELGDKFKAKKFDDDIMVNLTDDKLWLKQPFFSKFTKSATMEDFLTKEPNVDYICQIGKKLKVDAVLMYNTVSLDPFHPRITVSLIGVNDGKCYTEKDSGYFWTRERLSAGLKKVTEKVFMNFQENNLHSQLDPHQAGNLQ